jgi:CDP-diglyceride synthetase
LIEQQGLLKKFPINFEPALVLENVHETKQYHTLRGLTRMAFPHERFSIVLVTTLLCVILPFCTSGWLRLWCLNMSLAWLFFIVLHTTVSEPKDRFLVPMLSVSLWVCIIGGYQLARTLGKLVGKGDVRFSVQI